VYQRGRSRPARARRQRVPVSERVYQRGRSRPARAPPLRTEARDWECIKEAVPDQPELNGIVILRVPRVYQRGRSRPARALSASHTPRSTSVSKRPFPTSQSMRASISSARKSVSKRPFPTSQSLQTPLTSREPSVSKRPFPTSQSRLSTGHTGWAECIKEAVPDQPELKHIGTNGHSGVYQRGRSRPARADRRRRDVLPSSVSKRPFPTSQSTDDSHS